MTSVMPPGVSQKSLERFILSLADDELILGHRDSEWTGYGPILEEDIAFSNIAQDEIGHSLVWYSLYQDMTGADPDTMVFKRAWKDFSCCRFVEYPKSDFAYTVVRQCFFDLAEEVKLQSLAASSFAPLASASRRIAKEESYHRRHTQGLFERLGDATPESSRRMQEAVDIAFPQALGMFEPLPDEHELVSAGVSMKSADLLKGWMEIVVPLATAVSLKLPVKRDGGSTTLHCQPENGGRVGDHTTHLKSLVEDLQMVFSTAPGGKW